MKNSYWQAVLCYVLPTFPLGYIWHLVTFKSYYDALEVYRADIFIPLGVFSMIVQGCVWAFLYQRLFAGESVMRGAMKFAAFAFPLAWSYFVIAVAAKHRMASVSGFVLIETAFMAIHFAIVSPLIARCYAPRRA
jgi:hypothetical protein